jgi:hypothetical protein
MIDNDEELSIVKIVNEYLVVVDYGANSAADEGDILEIYEEGEEIFDHENNSLGTLDLVKAKIKVKNVYDNMSLCISNEFTKKYSSSGMGNVASMMSALQRGGTYKYDRRALNVNTTQISGGYDEAEITPISIGDKVRINKKRIDDDE